MAVSNCSAATKAILTSLLSLIICLPVGAQQRVPRVVISAGGPYTVRDSTIQRFRDNITVPREYAEQPLLLVFSNGAYSQTGFGWVRVFLKPGAGDSGGSEEVGRLLVDENSFISSPQLLLDMTGQMHEGQNPIYIEGAGTAGAVFSWELRSVGPPKLAKLNPSVTTCGANLIIAGTGFSLRSDENSASLGNFNIPVMATSQNAIKLYVPPNFPPGVYPLSISVRNYRSNLIKMMVISGPHISSLSTYNSRPGQTVTINGSGFSANPQENLVYVGRTPARIVSASQGALTFVVPNVGRMDGQSVSVFVRGTQASGSAKLAISY